MLVSTTLDHLTKLEHRLLELQDEMNHVEVFPTEAEKEKIIREMETMIAFTEQSEAVLARESKRSDLNMVERINFESALKITQVVAANLKVFEKKVKTIKVDPNHHTPKPHHPLHLTVADFQKIETRLIQLQKEITQLELSKSKTEQTRIINEIETAIAYINANLPKLKTELKRKDLTLQDQIIFEMGTKLGPILVKDLKEQEIKVKTIKTH